MNGTKVVIILLSLSIVGVILYFGIMFALTWFIFRPPIPIEQ